MHLLGASHERPVVDPEKHSNSLWALTLLPLQGGLRASGSLSVASRPQGLVCRSVECTNMHIAKTTSFAVETRPACLHASARGTLLQ
jgi:hypothetical protein